MSQFRSDLRLSGLAHDHRLAGRLPEEMVRKSTWAAIISWSARQIKPEIPETVDHGIPLRDELDLTRPVW